MNNCECDRLRQDNAKLANALIALIDFRESRDYVDKYSPNLLTWGELVANARAALREAGGVEERG
jgi:hypothetical protein